MAVTISAVTVKRVERATGVPSTGNWVRRPYSGASALSRLMRCATAGQSRRRQMEGGPRRAPQRATGLLGRREAFFLEEPAADLRRLGIEPATRVRADLGERGLKRQGRPVGTMGDHRLDHVGHREDAYFGQDLPDSEPPRVPGTVETLVVLVHDLGDRTAEVDRREDLPSCR